MSQPLPRRAMAPIPRGTSMPSPPRSSPHIQFPGVDGEQGGPFASQPCGGAAWPEDLDPESISNGVLRLPRSRVEVPRDAYEGVHFVDEELSLGTHFTDLLSPAVQPESNTCPTLETVHNSSVKGIQGRSKNFCDEEDNLIVSAWLNVSLDGINGVDQSKVTLWKKIYEYYHQNKTFTSDRTQGSLMNRWYDIQHDVNAFCGCIAKIEARNHSGWSIADKHAAACTLFKADDKKHRNFVFMHCWKILKDEPKWIDRSHQHVTQKTTSKKPKTTANSTPSSTAPLVQSGSGEEAQPSLERPAGTKKEKQRLRQRSSIEALDLLFAKKTEADEERMLKKEERCKKAFVLQEERLKFEKEKFEFQREMEEDKILSLDLCTMSYKQQKYFEARQDAILARRLNM